MVRPSKRAETHRPYKLTQIVEAGSVWARLYLNENFIPPPDYVIQEGIKAVRTINRYPDIDGYSLRIKIAEHLGLTPDMVFLSPGSIVLLYVLMYAFVDPEDEVILPRVSFAAYPGAVRAAGGRIVYVENMPEGGMPTDAILSALSPKTKAILLCSPNNPTGVIMTRGELIRLLNEVPEDILIVLDEAYYEYVTHAGYHYDSHKLIFDYPNLVVIRTFSKGYSLAGARLGYGLGVPYIWNVVGNFQPMYAINRPALYMARAIYGDEEFLNYVRKLTEKGRRELEEFFWAVGWKFLPSHGNFLMVYPDCEINAREIVRRLRERGVWINHTAVYGIEGWLRITVGSEEENEHLIKALEEVCGLST